MISMRDLPLDAAFHPEKYGVKQCPECLGVGATIQHPENCVVCGGSGLLVAEPELAASVMGS